MAGDVGRLTCQEVLGAIESLEIYHSAYKAQSTEYLTEYMARLGRGGDASVFRPRECSPVAARLYPRLTDERSRVRVSRWVVTRWPLRVDKVSRGTSPALCRWVSVIMFIGGVL